MTLTEGITQLAQSRQVSRVSRRRIEAALRTLERELGPLDFLGLTGKCELAQKVKIPGDDAVWIVIGEWEDGTFDLMREQGAFPEDVLVGWAPNQHIDDFWKDLKSIPEEPQLEVRRGGRPAPLFRSTSVESRA